MSSGFFGFFAHAGVLRVLEEEALLPARASGSSAGALVTGAFAAGVSSESLGAELVGLTRDQFWDPTPGPGLLAGRRFAHLLEELLPVHTFAECRIPAAISVFDLIARRTRVIEDGPLAPAIQASCTVPLMFHPVWRAGRPIIDGGVLDRPGLAGVPEHARVFYHHLESRRPWRRARDGRQRDVPRREGLTGLVIEGLPRVNPFRLEAGPRALEAAASATRLALDQPIVDDVVRLRRSDWL